ncbi:MAG: hypothetical protein VCC02_08320 [Myxococcota bacterium]
MGLEARIARLGRELGERESSHAAALETARERATELHAQVEAAMEGFHAAAATAGSPHLRIEVGRPRLDEKHVRAVEFEVQRGRTRGLFVVKARGDVTLVGPFATGKAEGPCQSIDFEDSTALAVAVEDFLCRFLEAAAQP